MKHNSLSRNQIQLENQAEIMNDVLRDENVKINISLISSDMHHFILAKIDMLIENGN